MTKYLAIDPGKYKCGFVIADFEMKKVEKAIIVKSDMLAKIVKDFRKKESTLKVVIGNGTTSKEHVKNLNFLGNNLKIVEERNSTLIAKERYFEIFPIKGLRKLIPREILLRNILLDAISALVILEDHLNCKFSVSVNLSTKTWRK